MTQKKWSKGFGMTIVVRLPWNCTWTLSSRLIVGVVLTLRPPDAQATAEAP